MGITSVITIDGPSGVGKSTLCKVLAESLRWNFLDSGVIYRVLALSALHYCINIASEEAVALLTMQLDFRFFLINGNLRVFLKEKDVSEEIFSQKVENVASKIALFPYVRKILLKHQRTFRKNPGLIANGRDMGTIVFPDAIAKIFLDASLEVRVNRRMIQLKEKGMNVNFSSLFAATKERDNYDRNRTIAPLIPAKDALFLDSTRLSIEQIIEKALKYVHCKLQHL